MTEGTKLALLLHFFREPDQDYAMLSHPPIYLYILNLRLSIARFMTSAGSTAQVESYGGITNVS